MGRGYPDYGVDEEFGKLLMPTDVAELAARLGSIITYDRRGSIVDWDDFEAPVLKWRITPGGVGCTAILDSTSVRSLAQALKLHTTNVVDIDVHFSRWGAIPVHRRLGIEASFSYLSNNCYLDLQVFMDNAITLYYGRVRINAQTGDLYIESPTTVFIPIGNVGIMFPQYFSFNTLKLVVDFTTFKYARIIANIDELDVSAYDLSIVASLGRRNFLYGGRLINKAIPGGDVWVDDVICTKDEP